MRAVEVIDQGVFQPCEVTLRVSENETRVFACQSNLRLLPGRRLTALATSEGNKYVIKIFPRRKRSLLEYDKEIDGYELLHSASLQVPARIYHGPAEDRLNIIVYKYISRARTLQEAFEKKPEGRTQQGLLRRFAELLAAMHSSQLIHEDPHLMNFLARGDSLTILDAGAVRRVSNDALLEKNYGLFVAQFPISWNLEDVFCNAYIGNHEVTEAYRDRLHQHVTYWQDRREQHFLKKIYRECTAFHVHSSISGKLIINRDFKDSGLIGLLDDPSSVFDGAGVSMLKEGNSSTVGKVVLNGSGFVIKRYNVKSTGHLLKQMVRESRASRSWRNAHRLQLRGLRTAKPVAIVECVKGKVKGVSLFVMQHVEGLNSADYFRSADVPMENKRRVAEKILDMIDELHEEHIIHGDMKSTNFIINNDEPVIVDLDAMQFFKPQTNIRKRIDRQLQRFSENWLDHAESLELFRELMLARYGSEA